MAISNDLISQFVQLTKEKKRVKESVVYGTVVRYDSEKYVKLDGSELLTPISLTADAEEGERVTVMIKDHSAIVTGNLTSPSARIDTVNGLNGEVRDIIAENVVVKNRLEANEAYIHDLEAENVKINNTLIAANAEIEYLKAQKIDAEIADITYATIESLDSVNAYIHNLEADYGTFKDLTTDKFTAQDATITRLETEKLSATDAEIKYANIDFANIGEAAIKKLFSDSGIIKDLIVSEGHITGELVGVTIKGDLIEGNTIVADKLVVKGSDGLYYKLNTDGVTTEAEQTEYNSLNGSVITAKSITATKISVTDLVAFGATIGGFNITNESIYSGVKSSADNTTRGIYMDRDGQFSIGDGFQYLRYFRDEEGNYKLDISAKSIKFTANDKTLEESMSETIVKSVEEFYLSDSMTELTGGTWSDAHPEWTEGKYIWRRSVVTHADGTTEYSPSENGVCISGNSGKTTYVHFAYADSQDGTQGFTLSASQNKKYIGQYTDFEKDASTDPTKYAWNRLKGDQGDAGLNGADAISMSITTDNGTIFKKSTDATTLTAHVYRGGVEQKINAKGVCGSLGTVKWYKGSDTTPVATGQSILISCSEVDGVASYTCQLEA